MDSLYKKLERTYTLIDSMLLSCETNITTDLKTIRSNIDKISHLVSQVQSKSESKIIAYHIYSLAKTIIGYCKLLLANTNYAHDHLNEIIVIAKDLLVFSKTFDFSADHNDFVPPDVIEYLNPTYSANILIVGQNKDSLDLIDRKLTDYDYNIFICSDPTKIITFLSKNKIDLILIDLVMSSIDGYNILQKIKAEQKFCDIPVIILSYLKNINIMTKYIYAGAEDYIDPSIHKMLLCARIRSCLSKKVYHDRAQQTLTELEETKDMLQTALENINEGFAIFDKHNNLVLQNNIFEELYPTNNNLNSLSSCDDSFIKHIKEEKLQYGNAYRTELPSGKWVEVFSKLLPNGGLVTVHKDISEQKDNEDKLKHKVIHDNTTGAYNRYHFDYMLTNIIAKAQEKKCSFGVLFFDMDNFKTINDNMGHDFGDFVLQKTAYRLQKCLRNKDIFARIGGDEFAAIIMNIKTTACAEKIANRCIAATNKSLKRRDKSVVPQISIGIALYNDDVVCGQDMLKCADKAMYKAKKSGKNTFIIY